MNLQERQQQLLERVMERIDFSGEISDGMVLDLIDDEMAGRTPGVPFQDRLRMRQEIFHSIRKLDILQDLLEDPEITEIMINGDDSIFIEKDGVIRQLEQRFVSVEKLHDVIQQIVANCNRVVNEASPIADARLADGARVSVVLPPVSLGGPVVTIRRFPTEPITIRRLIELGSVSEEIATFLGRLVAAGYNIFISGGTGSGKTTFLNALSEFIPAGERVITIEDNAELQIRHIRNLVRLEARGANVEGCVPVTIRDLIRASLRMRPDRIIVGEVRGAETIDMLQTLNTGHDGSMSTGHANSARDMISRLETMTLFAIDLPVAAIRGQIAGGIDIIVHLGRLRDHSRKVLEVCEVRGMEEGKVKLETLYRFVEEGGHGDKVKGCWKKENELCHTEKLVFTGTKL